MRTRLKVFRIEQGLSQEQIAKEIGYNRMTYAAVENGKREPTLRFCSALSRAFGITLDEVMQLMSPDKK